MPKKHSDSILYRILFTFTIASIILITRLFDSYLIEYVVRILYIAVINCQIGSMLSANHHSSLLE